MVSPLAGYDSGALLHRRLRRSRPTPASGSGHYFAIATLAVAEIIKQVFVSWSYVEGATGISIPIIPAHRDF